MMENIVRYSQAASPMPELPEVETFKRFIDQHALQKPIRAVQVFQPKILGATDAQVFQRALIGHTFSGTLRRGKQLFVQVQGDSSASPQPWLLLHFGMSGYLSYGKQGQTQGNAYRDATLKHAHVRIQFEFTDGSHLAFHEQRMFGHASLVDDPQAYLAAKKIGPDALSIDEAMFLTQLSTQKSPVKAFLLDQSMVAGIGNVYADEILFQCGIHPETRVSCLSPKERIGLFHQTTAVLQNTVAVGANRDLLPPNYMLHVRHTKGQCPRCGIPFEIKPVGGRTTYFCSACQKLKG